VTESIAIELLHGDDGIHPNSFTAMESTLNPSTETEPLHSKRK
jgi:hypothetical protein